MKKFLSLVLALVMTMSLVTVSAGAAEYKDLTDKDEIQYEEAVAVLNRLGIITGYSEGDFRPKTELTRGAAAKIIVSLLIGTDAANNLVASTAPYTDVPVDHTFAGVISYCKTSGIINGYQDGSFKPSGTLSGYAFSKMLLGALGYKGELEGFTGAGWNMKVAALGNEAGLFDRLSFKGNETVNREQACQLALNTLKATLVEYTGGMNVTNGDQTVVVNPNRSYKTSNQDFATNINAKTAANSSEYYTVEFGEEHFVDLRLEHDKKNPTPNDLGQPSAEWSYKKVTIGTYALEPDFRYTELVAHNDKSSTDASKVRALKLNGYEVDGSTQVWLNGYESNIDLGKVANIANYTDNGTVVEVYVSETNADLITDVVVIQSALVEVKRIGSDYVTLGKYDTDGADDNQAKEGFNRNAFDLVSDGGLAASKSFNDVQVEDRGYGVLSGLKAGDKVVVVPVSEDGSNARFDVWEAYVPETVTGALTRVDTYGSSSSNRGTIGLTVGGTAYKAAEWSKDIIGISGEDIKATKKDVTLTLDKYGNALLAEDVGATKDYMIIGNYYQSLENGRLVDYVHGWDVDGNEIDLNLGRDGKDSAMKPGDLVRYISNTTGSAEWKLQDARTPGNPGKIYAIDHTANSNGYQITAYNTKVALIQDTTGRAQANPDVTISSTPGTPTTVDFASGIKFIYVEFNDDNEVESVEIRKGVQAASNAELKACNDPATITTEYVKNDWNTAEAYVGGKTADGDVAVKAVVIKRESNTAISSNLLYIRDYLGSAQKTDSSNKIIYGYTVVMNTSDGLAGEAKTIYSYENLSVGSFASYAEVQNDQVSDFYKLRQHTNRVEKTTTSFVVNVAEVLESNNNILILDPSTYVVPEDRGTSVGTATGTTPGQSGGTRTDLPAISTIDYDGTEDKQIGELVDRVRVSGKTQWVDLTGNHIASPKDMKDFILGDNTKPLTVAMVVNDNVESDGFRDVAMIIIEEATRVGAGPVVPPPSAEGTVNVTVNGTSTGYVTVPNGDSTKIISSTGSFTAPRGSAVAIPLNVANGDDVVSISCTGTGASATKVGNQILVTPATSGDTTLTITIDLYVAPVALTVTESDADWENLTITADGTAIASGDDVTPGATVTISLTQVAGATLAADSIDSLAGATGIPAGATYSNTAGVTASAASVEEVTKPTITTSSGNAPSATEVQAFKDLAAQTDDNKLYSDNAGTTEWDPDTCTDVDDIPANLYIKWAAGEKTPAEKATLTITFEMPAAATTIGITDVE